MAHYAEMLNTNHPDDSTVKVPAVHPWARFPRCQSCGLTLAFGVPIVRRIVELYHGRVHGFGYCAGDHDSTLKLEAAFGVKVELATPCFGLFTPHLHLACNRCGYRWIMECAPAHYTDSFWRDFGAFGKWFLIVFGAVSLLFLLFADFIGYL